MTTMTDPELVAAAIARTGLTAAALARLVGAVRLDRALTAAARAELEAVTRGERDAAAALAKSSSTWGKRGPDRKPRKPRPVTPSRTVRVTGTPAELAALSTLPPAERGRILTRAASRKNLSRATPKRD